MTLDRVPGDDDLYIGGIFTLRRGRAIQDEGITHVVSALGLSVGEELFADCKARIKFDIDDEEQEDIMQYFAQSNTFIEEAFSSGGKVLVHCAMGKSRSATLVLAYLMRSRGLGADAALTLLREARPFAEPNPGFMEQLRLYEQMGSPADPGEHPVYQRWLFQRELARSREVRQAPDMELLRFEDELGSSKRDAAAVEQAVSSEAKEYRCRKCRRSLATSPYVVHVRPGGKKAGSGSGSGSGSGTEAESGPKSPPCSHIFVEPLGWMRPELELGKLDGRLECPNERCRQIVGKYAWQGSKCNCNEWLVPGISIHRSKIDEVRARTIASSAGAVVAGTGAGVPSSSDGKSSL